jgi:hypothetical protein
MHNIQLDIDFLAAVRAVSLSHTALHDVDLVIKTALTEGFGGAAIRPWSVLHQDGAHIRVTGYSALDVGELHTRLSLACPALQQAVQHVYSAPVSFEAGQSVRFAVRLAPTVNVTRRGERDAYLVAVEKGRRDTREAVYVEYLRDRLDGATVRAARMTRFRLERAVRPHRGRNAPDSGFAQRVMPDAVISGELTITDPTVFAQTLAAGVGRQRAYGRGWVRVEPLQL